MGAIDFSRAANWEKDPKHSLFVFSRYKFVARMMEGIGRVLEIGAGDGVASKIVGQFVGEVTCTDKAGGDVIEHDILRGPYDGTFGGAFALDVIEHIEPHQTWTFLENMKDSVVNKGVCIVGSPSVESQIYASPPSKSEHRNCMNAGALKREMLKHFYPVFMFGMNDEVVHTGHEGMRHYNFAVGVK